jgi:putative Holliday junction resolvase
MGKVTRVLIGIDYGETRIGVAVSDPEQKIAFPLGVVQRSQGGYGFRKLRALLQTRSLVEKQEDQEVYHVDGFVVGVPLRSDGRAGQEVDKVREYAQALESWFGRPVKLWDERFTTVMANKVLLESSPSRVRDKGLTDQVASQLILQSYLDHMNSGSTQTH